MKSIQLCLNRLGVCSQLLWIYFCSKSCPRNSEGTSIHAQQAIKMLWYESCISALQCESCCVLTTTQDTAVMAAAQELYTKFRTILLQFSKCHSLYDCNTITPDMIKCLGKCLLYQLFKASFFFICIDEAIKILFAILDSTFEKNCKNAPPSRSHGGVDVNNQASCGLMRDRESRKQNQCMPNSTPYHDLTLG